MPGPIIGPHGGYRNLRAYQLSEAIHDGAVAFARLYLRKPDRTIDQMVQAARSGKQNIAEGSQGAATSKKTELKLTGVARASLEELLIDYQDFLRQNGMSQWPKDHEKAVFIRKLRHPAGGRTDRTNPTDQTDQADRSDASDRSDRSDFSVYEAAPYETYRRYIETKGPENAANVMICLIHQTNYLLDKLLHKLERTFAEEGGITEKLYRARKNQH